MVILSLCGLYDSNHDLVVQYRFHASPFMASGCKPDSDRLSRLFLMHEIIYLPPEDRRARVG